MSEIFSYSETFTVTNWEIAAKSISDDEILHFEDSKEKNIARTIPQSINLYVKPRTQFQSKTVRIPALGDIQRTTNGIILESIAKYAPSRIAVGSDMWIKTKVHSTYYLREYEEHLRFPFFVTYVFHRGMTQPYKWDPINPNFPHVLPNSYTLVVNDFLSVQMIGPPIAYSAIAFNHIQTFYSLSIGNEILKSLIYFFKDIHIAEDIIIKARPPIGNVTDNVLGFPLLGLSGDVLVENYGWKTKNLSLRNRLYGTEGKRFNLKSGIHTTYNNYHHVMYFDPDTKIRYNVDNSRSAFQFHRSGTKYRIMKGNNPHYYPYHDIYVAEKGSYYRTYQQYSSPPLAKMTFRNKDIYPEDWRIFVAMAGKSYWNYTNNTNTSNPLGFPIKRDYRDHEYPAVILKSNLRAFEKSSMYEDFSIIIPVTAHLAEGLDGLSMGIVNNIENVYSPIWVPITAREIINADSERIVTTNPNNLISLMSWRSEYVRKVGGYAKRNILYLPNNSNYFYKKGVHSYNDLYRTTGDGNAKYIEDKDKKEGVDTAWYYTNWNQNKANPGVGDKVHFKTNLDGNNITLKKINESNSIIASYRNGLPVPPAPPGFNIDALLDSHYAPGQKVKDYWNNHKKHFKTPLPVEKIDNFTLSGGKNVNNITAMSPDASEESVTGLLSYSYGIDFDNYRIYGNGTIINIRAFILGESNEKIYDGIKINSGAIIDQTGRIYKQLTLNIVENIISFSMPMETISRYSKRFLNFIIEDTAHGKVVIIRYPFLKDSMDITEIQNTSIIKLLA